MMSVAFFILGLVLLFLAFVGAVLPIVPGGPLFAFFGLLSLFGTAHPPSTAMWVTALVVVGIASVLDYVVPMWGAKKFKSSRAGVIGCFIGSLAGCLLATVASFFLTPVVGAVVLVLGLLLGPFFGTMAGELIAKRSFGEAFGGGVGAMLGYIVSVWLKLLACLIVTVQFFWVWLSGN